MPPDFKAPNSDDAEEKDRFMESVLEENIAADQAVKPATGWDAADGNNESRKVADGVETIEFSRVLYDRYLHCVIANGTFNFCRRSSTTPAQSSNPAIYQ